MASSFIQWNSPNVDLDNATTMTAFFEDFDAKMLELGLIKIQSESSAYVQPPNWPTTTVNQGATVAKYTYMLPKGFAKTEFEDIPNQTYKKIKRASYYKTDTQIQFVFKYVKASALNLPLTDPLYMNKTSLLYCDLFSRNTSNGIFQTLGPMGAYYTVNSNTIISGDGNRQVPRGNYAIHTEDILSIFFGNIVYTNSNIGDMGTSTSNPIISFVLKRDNEKNAHTIMCKNADRLTSSQSSDAMNMHCFENDNVTSYSHLAGRTNFFTWQMDISDATQGGEVMIYPCLAVYNSGYKKRNNSFYITKNIPENATVTENNAVILYRNTPTLISTLFLGKHSKPFSLGNYNFGFMLIKPNHEVITGDLT